MKKSRFVEFTTPLGFKGSVHVDTIVVFEEVSDGYAKNATTAIHISSISLLIYAQEPYETIKDRINEAMS